MKRIFVLLAIVSAISGGCVSNPINRVTSDNYSEVCAEAEQKGNLKVAEEACYRALVNVDMGNLGEELKSERLYNLARIKRQVAKFSEAESLLTQSLVIEEKSQNPSSIKVGRRLAELSVNLAAQNRWSEGIPHVERLSGLAGQYSGHERAFIIQILQQYGAQLSSQGNNDTASTFQAKALELENN